MKKTFAAARVANTSPASSSLAESPPTASFARVSTEAARRGLEIAFPTLALSTDNAAMIAAAAWPRFVAQDFAPPDLSADPSLALS